MERIGVIPLPAAKQTMFFEAGFNLKLPSGFAIQMGKSVDV
jgi:hypothetical protein